MVASLEALGLVVLERNFRRWGLFAYLGPQGPVATVRKAVGRLEGVAPSPRQYPLDANTLLASQADLLGEIVLKQGEPSYESVVGYLPDLTGYTFLGVPERSEKIAVEPDGTIGLLGGYGRSRIERLLFDPKWYLSALSAPQAKRGLLGGYLPAIDYGFFDKATRQGWELLALGAVAGGNEPAGTLLVALKVGSRWRYYALEPVEELPDGKRFFTALLDLQRYWERFFREGVEVNLPEPRLMDACRAGIARARITYEGNRPKYGIGVYAAPVHDGFPPTTLFMGIACLEWGLFGPARDLLEYYLTHFIRADGTFDYYGPAVSEYGMLLGCAARLVRYTGDREWLARNLEPLQRVAEYLLRLRQESLQRTAGNAAHRGLLFGPAEADTHREVNYYYSGSAWAWRGLREWGQLLIEEFPAYRPWGQEVLEECLRLREDMLRSMESAKIDGDTPFLPPFPGLEKPFSTMTSDTLASYTNYRYWPEMLSSGLLPEPLARALFEYRRRHGGEFCGTTRFEGHLDDWPLAHHAWGLLEWDRVEQYLLATYGHLAHHQMRGTFNAYEQVHVRYGDIRSYVADYCVPAQLTIPLLTKWMLVFEEYDHDRLWLCKAVPRRWFAPGQGFAIRRAPTRWGPVSLKVHSTADRITVSLEAPVRAPAELWLRLRHPQVKAPRRVWVNSRESDAFEASREALCLQGVGRETEVIAEYE